MKSDNITLDLGDKELQKVMIDLLGDENEHEVDLPINSVRTFFDEEKKSLHIDFKLKSGGLIYADVPWNVLLSAEFFLKLEPLRQGKFIESGYGDDEDVSDRFDKEFLDYWHKQIPLLEEGFVK